MAVIFEQIDGWCRPRFVCDACEQPITDVRMAMVVYEESDMESGSITAVRHSHKDDPCQERVRKLAGHQSLSGMWDELANHVVMLAADIGLFPNEFSEQYEHLQRRQMVRPPPGEDT